jgi:DNA polymerase-3 subunit epsilon
MSESRELLESLEFCVIDLETTGGNHDNDQIIEIGLVNIKSLQIVDTKNILVNPEKIIPDFIQKLTSIKQKDVEDCPTIDQVIDEVIEFIGDNIIVAHNTSFDVPFLNSVLRRLGKPELGNKVICTNVMTKHMIPEIMTSNLNYMSQLFGIEHEQAHRAKDDAVASAKLLLKYLEIFESKGIKKVNQLYYPRNKFELDRIHFKSDDDHEVIKQTIMEHNTSMQITLKGSRGLILAVLPIESPKQEIDFILECMGLVDWEIITISLLKPVLEGIFQFNNHFQKYPEDVRVLILDYLNKRYKSNNGILDEYRIENMDFLVGHHLVRNQISVFSFLNLNTNTKHLFKIPAHKKKLMHFLNHQISKFENGQKGRKRTLLHKELIPLVENYLSKERNKGNYLYLNRQEVKGNPGENFKQIENFVFERTDEYLFPQKHL